MNLTIDPLKYFVLLTCLLTSTVSFSADVTWNLSFLDSQNKLVGTGQFTYDPTTDKEITPIIGNAFEVESLIKSISIDLVGVDWGYEGSPNFVPFRSSGPHWWNNPGVTEPGSQPSFRFTSFIRDSWDFYRYKEESAMESTLTMSSFTTISPTLWTGTWQLMENLSSSEESNGMFIVTAFTSTLPSFSFTSGELAIPAVIVNQNIYAVKMHLTPTSDPLTFTVTEAITLK